MTFPIFLLVISVFTSSCLTEEVLVELEHAGPILRSHRHLIPFPSFRGDEIPVAEPKAHTSDLQLASIEEGGCRLVSVRAEERIASELLADAAGRYYLYRQVTGFPLQKSELGQLEEPKCRRSNRVRRQLPSSIKIEGSTMSVVVTQLINITSADSTVRLSEPFFNFTLVSLASDIGIDPCPKERPRSSCMQETVDIDVKESRMNVNFSADSHMDVSTSDSIIRVTKNHTAEKAKLNAVSMNTNATFFSELFRVEVIDADSSLIDAESWVTTRKDDDVKDVLVLMSPVAGVDGTTRGDLNFLLTSKSGYTKAFFKRAALRVQFEGISIEVSKENDEVHMKSQHYTLRATANHTGWRLAFTDTAILSMGTGVVTARSNGDFELNVSSTSTMLLRPSPDASVGVRTDLDSVSLGDLTGAAVDLASDRLLLSVQPTSIRAQSERTRAVISPGPTSVEVEADRSNITVHAGLPNISVSTATAVFTFLPANSTGIGHTSRSTSGNLVERSTTRAPNAAPTTTMPLTTPSALNTETSTSTQTSDVSTAFALDSTPLTSFVPTDSARTDTTPIGGPDNDTATTPTTSAPPSELTSATRAPSSTGADNATDVNVENSTVVSVEASTLASIDNSTVSIFENSTISSVENATVSIFVNSTISSVENATVSIFENSTAPSVENTTDNSVATTPSSSTGLISTISTVNNSTVGNSENATDAHLEVTTSASLDNSTATDVTANTTFTSVDNSTLTSVDNGTSANTTITSVDNSTSSPLDNSTVTVPSIENSTAVTLATSSDLPPDSTANSTDLPPLNATDEASTAQSFTTDNSSIPANTSATSTAQPDTTSSGPEATTSSSDDNSFVIGQVDSGPLDPGSNWTVEASLDSERPLTGPDSQALRRSLQGGLRRSQMTDVAGPELKIEIIRNGVSRIRREVSVKFLVMSEDGARLSYDEMRDFLEIDDDNRILIQASLAPLGLSIPVDRTFMFFTGDLAAPSLPESTTRLGEKEGALERIIFGPTDTPAASTTEPLAADLLFAATVGLLHMGIEADTSDFENPNFVPSIEERLAAAFRNGSATERRRKRRQTAEQNAHPVKVKVHSVRRSPNGVVDVEFHVETANGVVPADSAAQTFARLSKDELGKHLSYTVSSPVEPSRMWHERLLSAGGSGPGTAVLGLAAVLVLALVGIPIACYKGQHPRSPESVSSGSPGGSLKSGHRHSRASVAPLDVAERHVSGGEWSLDEEPRRFLNQLPPIREASRRPPPPEADYYEASSVDGLFDYPHYPRSPRKLQSGHRPVGLKRTAPPVPVSLDDPVSSARSDSILDASPGTLRRSGERLLTSAFPLSDPHNQRLLNRHLRTQF